MSEKSLKRLILLIGLAIVFTALMVPVASAADGPKIAIPAIISTSPFISASQCALCHGANLDNFKNPILYFKHDPHLTRGIRCAACHDAFPHGPQGTVKPGMTVCYNCHGLGHGQQAVVASGACSFCHPNGYGGAPTTHSMQFIAGQHKTEAAKDSFPCKTCHGIGMCADCHTAKNVKPDDHKAVTWKKTHGQNRDNGNCDICHTQSFCENCHVTPMPHPAQWEGQHKEAAKTMKNDCKVCHADSQAECSSCHHQFQQTDLLVEKTCTPCHQAYTQPLSTLIWGYPVGQRNKGFIVHKAHFEMTKTDPFECSECHDRTYTTAKGCYGFELCYNCHGRMRGGSLIAKWGGQELCYRCHQKK